MPATLTVTRGTAPLFAVSRGIPALFTAGTGGNLATVDGALETEGGSFLLLESGGSVLLAA